jgi:hypothetical protein
VLGAGQRPVAALNSAIARLTVLSEPEAHKRQSHGKSSSVMGDFSEERLIVTVMAVTLL